jgi:hypothetical protein
MQTSWINQIVTSRWTEIPGHAAMLAEPGEIMQGPVEGEEGLSPAAQLLTIIS